MFFADVTAYNLTQIGINLTSGMYKSAQQASNTCFVVINPILTVSGLVAIENIKVGDKVISADIETGDASEKTVLETYVRKVHRLVHLIVNGEEIVTTVDHPFYVKERGFIEAGRLFVGDKLISVNGDDLIVDEIKIQQCENPVNVYNFKVAEYHTYFVGKKNILVHNAQNYSSNITPEMEEKILEGQL